MLKPDEMDRYVIEAKKQLTDEQIKDAVRKASYGGSMVIRPLDCQGINMRGGDFINGKTNI